MIRRIAPIGLTIATLLASACSPQATMPPQSAANAPAAPSAPAPTAEAGTLTPAQQALVARAATLGATDLSTKAAPGGGFVLDGKLGGDQFALGQRSPFAEHRHQSPFGDLQAEAALIFGGNPARYRVQ